MSVLEVLGIVAVAVGAYFAAGWRIAVNRLPKAWAIARREWSSEDTIRGSVKEQTVCMTLSWPIYLTWCAVSDRLGEVTEHADPVSLAAKIRERDARIAELERELGVGRKPGHA